MPSRSYSQPPRVGDVWARYTQISGSPPPNDRFLYTGTTKLIEGSYQGVNTPGYHKRLKAGELLPLQPYERFDYVEESPRGTYGGTYDNGYRKYNYHVNSIRSMLGSSMSVVACESQISAMISGINYDALLQAAYSNMQPDLDTLTSLAELGKTIKLVTGFRKRWVDLLTRARKGNLRSAAEATGDAWLEWRYGWRILGYEFSAIANFVEHPIRDLIEGGQAGQSFTDSSQIIETFIGYYCQHDLIYTHERDVSVRVSAVSKFSSRAINTQLSIPNTAWELIPFSFVADWFVSIGDTLKAFEVSQSATTSYASLSYKYHETGRLALGPSSKGSGTYASAPYATGSAHSRADYLKRIPISAAPTFIPQFNVDLDWKKWADLASLFLSINSDVSRI